LQFTASIYLLLQFSTSIYLLLQFYTIIYLPLLYNSNYRAQMDSNAMNNRQIDRRERVRIRRERWQDMPLCVFISENETCFGNNFKQDVKGDRACQRLSRSTDYPARTPVSTHGSKL